MVGQAFQIQDDILGIFGSEKSIGKSILSDLVESKKTILVCHAYRSLKGRQKSRFLKCFSKKKKTYRDLVEVRKIFLKSKSLEYSLRKTESLVAQSIKMVSGLTIKDSYRTYIIDLLLSLFVTSSTIAKDFEISFNIQKKK